jgi:hypothetical protein
LSHKKFIVALALLSLIASIIAGYSAIPKGYSLGEHLVQTCIFWTDKEAFFFLTVNTMGQTDNFVLDKLGKARYSCWAYFLGSGPRFMDTRIVAYHLLPSEDVVVTIGQKEAATTLTRANRGLWRMGTAGRPAAGTYRRVPAPTSTPDSAGTARNLFPRRRS